MITKNFQLSIDNNIEFNISKLKISLNKINDFGFDSIVIYDSNYDYNIDAKEALAQFFENIAFYAPYEVDDDDLEDIPALVESIFIEYSEFIKTINFSEYQ